MTSPSQSSNSTMKSLLDWVQGPKIADEKLLGRSESRMEWLSRSTTSEASEQRSIISGYLSLFPESKRESLYRALYSRWESALFELVVAWYLVELGGDLQYEIELEDGKRPDFVARFAESTVCIEAVSPELNNAAAKELRNAQQLMKIVDTHIPQGWHICVMSLPQLGPSHSKREFTRAVKKLLDIQPPDAGEKIRVLSHETASGPIEIQAFADSSGAPMASGPMLTYWDDTEKRIRHALKSKRRQVRSSTHPVLLAISVGEKGRSALELFDSVLYGTTVGHTDIVSRVSIAKSFDANGEWTKRGQKNRPPVYDGVLAFCSVGLTAHIAPIMYHHPRTVAKLPSELLSLEQRYYGIGKILPNKDRIDALAERSKARWWMSK